MTNWLKYILFQIYLCAEKTLIAASKNSGENTTLYPILPKIITNGFLKKHNYYQCLGLSDG